MPGIVGRDANKKTFSLAVHSRAEAMGTRGCAILESQNHIANSQPGAARSKSSKTCPRRHRGARRRSGAESPRGIQGDHPPGALLRRVYGGRENPGKVFFIEILKGNVPSVWFWLQGIFRGSSRIVGS